MKIIGKIDVTDYIAAQKLNMRPSRTIRLILYCLLILTLFMYSKMIKYIIIKGHYPYSFWLLTICIGYIFIYFKFIIPIYSRKMYRQYTALHKPFEIITSDEYFYSESEEGKSQTKWTEFRKWKENRSLFLIYRADNVFHILPKRYFSTQGDIEFIRNILLDKIGKETI